MSEPCIDVVLATYNGERYLEQQIRSIQEAEGYSTLVARIIVVDDGSTDATHDIVSTLQRIDSKIKWFTNESGEHGAKENFAYALGLAESEYVMLCDQDDVWERNKISLSYDAISGLQSDRPALLFTDKTIVDESLRVICDSFFKYRQIPKSWYHSTERLLHMNVASGCTMMFNKALLKKAIPVPTQAFMHDWWLILIAKELGEIIFIDKATIKYRQHNHNAIGANDYSLFYLVRNFSHHLAKFERNFWCAVDQAHQIAHFLDSCSIKSLPFVHFRQYGYWRRLGYFFTGRVYQHNWKSRLALFLILLKGTSYDRRNSP